MQAGNARYLNKSDLPQAIAVFPLSGALLLPGGQIPLNIFEPRYLEMIDDAMRGDRLIGMVQPKPSAGDDDQSAPALFEIGCIGRITSYTETGDGRYLISLQGICRFRVLEEKHTARPYRICHIAPFIGDLTQGEGAKLVDRAALLRTFKAYLDANGMETDWESVQRADNEVLVNALSMMSPYGPAEKQALLEAPDLKTRAETLIAITEMHLARTGDDASPVLQ
jgi:Lon protease-like protein